MAQARQAQLFDTAEQLELFGEPPASRPDLDKVRARLEKLLIEARAAEAMPWEPTRLSLYRRMVPEIASFLPPEEGEQMRLSFEAEVVRLFAKRQD